MHKEDLEDLEDLEDAKDRKDMEDRKDAKDVEDVEDLEDGGDGRPPGSEMASPRHVYNDVTAALTWTETKPCRSEGRPLPGFR
jgi:hypothetical protein